LKIRAERRNRPDDSKRKVPPNGALGGGERFEKGERGDQRWVREEESVCREESWDPADGWWGNRVRVWMVRALAGVKGKEGPE
jgi:hypothetical protein